MIGRERDEQRGVDGKREGRERRRREGRERRSVGGEVGGVMKKEMGSKRKGRERKGRERDGGRGEREIDGMRKREGE